MVSRVKVLDSLSVHWFIGSSSTALLLFLYVIITYTFHFLYLIYFLQGLHKIRQSTNTLYVQHQGASEDIVLCLNIKGSNIKIHLGGHDVNDFLNYSFPIEACNAYAGQERDMLTFFPLGLDDTITKFGHLLYSIRATGLMNHNLIVGHLETHHLITRNWITAICNDILDNIILFIKHEHVGRSGQLFVNEFIKSLVGNLFGHLLLELFELFIFFVLNEENRECCAAP